ncbi:hypothetical protein [Nitrososphaera sp.]|uniref:hypothetical protein n=1 Tax=Nitrososphaera sp. TaxID=1971748 RepID=UPI00307D1109
MVCKGMCIHYRSKARYSDANKRCQVCDIFIQWEGARCPCCRFILRSKARNPRRHPEGEERGERRIAAAAAAARYAL